MSYRCSSCQLQGITLISRWPRTIRELRSHDPLFSFDPPWRARKREDPGKEVDYKGPSREATTTLTSRISRMATESPMFLFWRVTPSSGRQTSVFLPPKISKIAPLKRSWKFRLPNGTFGTSISSLLKVPLGISAVINGTTLPGAASGRCHRAITAWSDAIAAS